MADVDASSSAAPSPAPEEPKPTVAPLNLTVLLQTGIRLNITLDQTFLSRHAIKTPTGKEDLEDPFEMSVWQLKECIWKDWRDDMDIRPASALFIKLIQFGGFLQDSSLLRECRFTPQGPNVIHMAIRPAEVGDDDATQRSAKGVFGGREREGSASGAAGGSGGRSPSCRCVIL